MNCFGTQKIYSETQKAASKRAVSPQPRKNEPATDGTTTILMLRSCRTSSVPCSLGTPPLPLTTTPPSSLGLLRAVSAVIYRHFFSACLPLLKGSFLSESFFFQIFAIFFAQFFNLPYISGVFFPNIGMLKELDIFASGEFHE